MSTKLFLETTNPKLTWNDVINKSIIFSIFLSIILNTTVYTIILNLASYVFLGKILSNKINIRLIIVLVIIMIFGLVFLLAVSISSFRKWFLLMRLMTDFLFIFSKILRIFLSRTILSILLNILIPFFVLYTSEILVHFLFNIISFSLVFNLLLLLNFNILFIS